MITPSALSAEHAALDALAAKLMTMISEETGPTPALSALRWQMNRVLMVHLAKEDQHLYPVLRARTGTRAAQIAARFADEMGGLAAAYRDYTNRWTTDRMASDWRGYGDDTRKIVRALRHRIMREERDLYPLIDADDAPSRLSA